MENYLKQLDAGNYENIKLFANLADATVTKDGGNQNIEAKIRGTYGGDIESILKDVFKGKDISFADILLKVNDLLSQTKIKIGDIEEIGNNFLKNLEKSGINKSQLYAALICLLMNSLIVPMFDFMDSLLAASSGSKETLSKFRSLVSEDQMASYLPKAYVLIKSMSIMAGVESRILDKSNHLFKIFVKISSYLTSTGSDPTSSASVEEEAKKLGLLDKLKQYAKKISAVVKIDPTKVITWTVDSIIDAIRSSYVFIMLTMYILSNIVSEAIKEGVVVDCKMLAKLNEAPAMPEKNVVGGKKKSRSSYGENLMMGDEIANVIGGKKSKIMERFLGGA